MATAKKSARKSAKTTAPEIEPEAAARNRQNAANRAAGKADTTRNHDANPDVSTDSSVRHAEPPDGRRDGSGHGGYPSGEYDVTPPEPGADAKTKGATASALGHLYANSPEADRAVAQAKRHARLEPAEFDKAVEALPVGTVIEHEGPNRWRVHVAGQPRYGHGGTHSEAVESYVLGGESVTAEQQAAERLAALPKRQRQEIAERDRKAAEAVGGSSATASSGEITEDQYAGIVGVGIDQPRTTRLTTPIRPFTPNAII